MYFVFVLKGFFLFFILINWKKEKRKKGVFLLVYFTGFDLLGSVSDFSKVCVVRKVIDRTKCLNVSIDIQCALEMQFYLISKCDFHLIISCDLSICGIYALCL